MSSPTVVRGSSRCLALPGVGATARVVVRPLINAWSALRSMIKWYRRDVVFAPRGSTRQRTRTASGCARSKTAPFAQQGLPAMPRQVVDVSVLTIIHSPPARRARCSTTPSLVRSAPRGTAASRRTARCRVRLRGTAQGMPSPSLGKQRSGATARVSGAGATQRAGSVRRTGIQTHAQRARRALAARPVLRAPRPRAITTPKALSLTHRDVSVSVLGIGQGLRAIRVRCSTTQVKVAWCDLGLETHEDGILFS